MARKGLTPVAVANLKPAAVRQEIPDGKSRGLYLILQPSGRRSWCVRYRRPIDGRSRKFTLGDGSMSLAAARAAAASALHEVEQGRDPGEARKAAKAKAADETANTLANVVDEYIARESKRLRTIGDRKRIFDRLILPRLGNRPITDIQRIDVVRLLDRIEDDNGPRMADMVLAILGRVFNWHAIRSNTFRSPIVRGMARCDVRERARSRILTDDELRRVWVAADSLAPPRGAFVRLMLLTAARRSELAKMRRRGEIDGTDWVLPASRNKTKVALVRPLSGAAQAVLARIPRVNESEFVFSGVNGKRPLGGFSWMKRDLDRLSGITNYTFHDLRRTARSLMSRAGVPSDHAERCLGHVIGGVRGTYDRHEYHREKQLAYEALAALIERIVEPQANVVAWRT